MAEKTLSVKYSTEGFTEVVQSLQKVGTSFDQALNKAKASVNNAVAASRKALAQGDTKAFEDAEKAKARAAQQATQTISNAYRELGVRSSADLQKQKQQAISAFEAIKTSGVASARDIAAAQKQLELRLAQLDSQLKGMASVGGGFTIFKGAVASFLGGAALQAVGAVQNAFVGLGQQVIQTGAAAERQAVAFETFLGSAEKAKQLMKEVRDFAATTPFELPEVTEAAKTLLAKGVAAEEIIPSIKRLGEIAAGADKPLNQLLFVYGQIKDQGRAMGQDLNQLTNAGISIGDIAKALNISQAEVREFVSQGKFGFAELEKVIVSVTSEGGRFYGLMDKLGGTTAVKLSNLNDAFTKIYQSIYNGVSPAISTVLDLIVGMVNPLGENESLFAQINERAKEFQAFFQDNPQIARELGQALQSLVQEAMNAVADAAQELTNYLKQNPQAIQEAITGLKNMIQQMGLLVEATKPFLELIKLSIEGWTKIGGIVKSIRGVMDDPEHNPTPAERMELEWKRNEPGTQKLLAAVEQAGGTDDDAAKILGNARTSLPWWKFGGYSNKEWEEYLKREVPKFMASKGGGGSAIGELLGITGNTGKSTGAHLDLRYASDYMPSRPRLSAEHINRFLVDGKPLSSYGVTSEHASRNPKRPTHLGVDFGTPVGGKITSTVPIASVSKPVWDDGGGGWYTTVTFTDGVKINLLHQDPSVRSAGVGKGGTPSQQQFGPPAPYGPPAPKGFMPTPVSTGTAPKAVAPLGAPPPATLTKAEKDALKAREQAAIALKNQYQYLARIAAGESSGGKNIGPNPSTGAYGEYQFVPSSRSSLMARGGPDPWSKAKAERDKAALKWIEFYGKEVGVDLLGLIRKGEFATVDKILGKNQFTSLPGGAEASRIWQNPANLRKYAPIGKVEGDTYYRQAEDAKADAERKAREIIETARRSADTQRRQQQELALKQLELSQTAKLQQFDLETAQMPPGAAKDLRTSGRTELERQLALERQRTEIAQAIENLKVQRTQKLQDQKAGRETDPSNFSAEINFLNKRLTALQETYKVESEIQQLNQRSELEAAGTALDTKYSEVLAQAQALTEQFGDLTDEVQTSALEREIEGQFSGVKQAIAEVIAETTALITTRESAKLSTTDETKKLEELQEAYLDVTDAQRKATQQATAQNAAARATAAASQAQQLQEIYGQIDQAEAHRLEKQGKFFEAEKLRLESAQRLELARQATEMSGLQQQLAAAKNDEERQSIERLIGATQELNAVKLDDLNSQFQTLGSTIAGIVTDAVGNLFRGLKDVWAGTKGLGDALLEFFANIAQGIADFFLQQALTGLNGWLSGLFGGLFGGGSSSGGLGSLFGSLFGSGGSGGGLGSLFGGLFGGGGATGFSFTPIPGFADGGSVRAPFGIVSSGEFVMRAAAVQNLGQSLLLEMNRSGKVPPLSGLRLAENDRRGRTVTPQINMTVVSPDANSFRKSETQIGREAGEMYRRSVLRNS